jgi:hypothetical protein
MDEQEAIMTKELDEKDEKPNKYDWLLDMKQSELRGALQQYEGDLLIVYDKCGFEMLTALWEHLPGIPVYPSKKAFYRLAAMYARQNYNPDDPEMSKKAIAARIGVSLRSVEMWLATTDKTDIRQVDLFIDGEKK